MVTKKFSAEEHYIFHHLPYLLKNQWQISSSVTVMWQTLIIG